MTTEQEINEFRDIFESLEDLMQPGELVVLAAENAIHRGSDIEEVANYLYKEMTFNHKLTLTARLTIHRLFAQIKSNLEKVAMTSTNQEVTELNKLAVSTGALTWGRALEAALRIRAFSRRAILQWAETKTCEELGLVIYKMGLMDKVEEDFNPFLHDYGEYQESLGEELEEWEYEGGEDEIPF